MDTFAIGETAGKIWQYLSKKGETPVTTLVRVIEVDTALVQMALGWLAREDKVRFTTNGRQPTIALTERELQKV